MHGHVSRRQPPGERLLRRRRLLPDGHPVRPERLPDLLRGEVQHLRHRGIQPLQLRRAARGRRLRLPHHLHNHRRVHGRQRQAGAPRARLGHREQDVRGGQAQLVGLRLRQQQQRVRRLQVRTGQGIPLQLLRRLRRQSLPPRRLSRYFGLVGIFPSLLLVGWLFPLRRVHGGSCMPGRFGRLVLADINECQDERYPCSVPDTCVNTIGGYSCVCPEKTSGNAYNGTCEQDKSQIGWEIAIGVSIGVIVLIAAASCAYMIYAKRRLAKIKREYFEQHGGLTLFDEMRSRQGLSFKLFTQEELEEATGRFDERNVIGKGANGTVYKGTTKDGDLVAIKKCRLASERQQKEFGKEMLIVSQINHRYIVKLYGCCLEVEVPMLVYKYIPNGTLYRLIHGRREREGPRIPFTARLKIAHQTAEALSYLHSWASPPILHGDVKTSNILLDEDYTAKVSDFGASTLAPTDEAQFVTFVQGTCGYLDPEYMRTCKLTDKSDVYSFGVVLLELLTCRKALNLEELEEEKYLSSQFLLVLGENRLEEMLDPQIKREQSIEVLEQAAELAKRCLEMLGENRPSMREVAEELHRLSKLAQHPWGPPDSAELVELLRGSPSPTTYSGHSGSGVELSSTRNVSFTDTAYIGIQSPR
ncbi:hypothetical protein VPH35_111299 [Triticum aestivum]